MSLPSSSRRTSERSSVSIEPPQKPIQGQVDKPYRGSFPLRNEGGMSTHHQCLACRWIACATPELRWEKRWEKRWEDRGNPALGEIPHARVTLKPHVPRLASRSTPLSYYTSVVPGACALPCRAQVARARVRSPGRVRLQPTSRFRACVGPPGGFRVGGVWLYIIPHRADRLNPSCPPAFRVSGSGFRGSHTRPGSLEMGGRPQRLVLGAGGSYPPSCEPLRRSGQGIDI